MITRKQTSINQNPTFLRSLKPFFLGVAFLLTTPVFAKLSFGPILTQDGIHAAFYEKTKNGDYLMGGDMLVEPVSRSNNNQKAVHKRFSKWDKAIVPYTIDESIPNQSRIHGAVNYINTYTKVRMVERTNEKDYVHFKNNGDDDCSSWVGKKGGKQNINVPAWCGQGSIVHEVMHALGFYHEQSRPDRRKWIKIKWTNIQLKRWHNFFAAPFAKSYDSFDFDSIMLYPSFNGFAKDKSKPTMTTKDGGVWDSQRRGLSHQDIEGLHKRYGL